MSLLWPVSGCGKVTGCFLFGRVGLFLYVKRTSFHLLLNTSLREAEDCFLLLLCFQRSLPTPWYNNSLILDKACVRKVYWLLANKEWEWVYLLSSTTILNCYEETFPALAINQAGMETAPQNYFKKEEKMRRPHFTVWSWQVTKSKTSWVAHSWLCTDT